VLGQLGVVQRQVAETWYICECHCQCCRPRRSCDFRPLTSLQAPQRNAVNPNGFIVIVVLTLLTNGKLDEDKILHVAHAVKGNAQFLLPHRIEPVVLDHLRSEGNCSCRRHSCWRGARRWGVFDSSGRRRFRKERRVRPVWNVERHLHEWIHNRLLDNFLAFGVSKAR